MEKKRRSSCWPFLAHSGGGQETTFYSWVAQFLKINLRPILTFEGRLFWNLSPVCTMNAELVLGNGALAATQEIR